MYFQGIFKYKNIEFIYKCYFKLYLVLLRDVNAGILKQYFIQIQYYDSWLTRQFSLSLYNGSITGRMHTPYFEKSWVSTSARA